VMADDPILFMPSLSSAARCNAGPAMTGPCRHSSRRRPRRPGPARRAPSHWRELRRGSWRSGRTEPSGPARFHAFPVPLPRGCDPSVDAPAVGRVGAPAGRPLGRAAMTVCEARSARVPRPVTSVCAASRLSMFPASATRPPPSSTKWSQNVAEFGDDVRGDQRCGTVLRAVCQQDPVDL
jgi:hypothetical protein